MTYEEFMKKAQLIHFIDTASTKPWCLHCGKKSPKSGDYCDGSGNIFKKVTKKQQNED